MLEKSLLNSTHQALRAECDFLINVLDNIDALVIVLDKNGKIIRINRACERIFGYSNAEVRTKITTGALPLPGNTLAFHEFLHMLRSNPRNEHYETEWVDKDGSLRTIAWTISTFMDENNQLEYIFSSGIDITARKNVELQLESERTFLKSLINSIPDMIFNKDLSGVYRGCNYIFEKMSQRKVADIIGLSDEKLYPPDIAPFFLETDKRVIETGKALVYTNWVKEPGGRKILIETRKTPYYDHDGKMIGVIGVGRDITEHYNTENKLRSAKSEIEQLIASLSSVLIVLSTDGVVTHWNPMAEKIFSIPANMAINNSLKAIPISWDWNAIQEGIVKCREDNQPNYLDPMRFKRNNGEEGFLGVCISPLRDSNMKPVGYILLSNDITERKIIENRLAQSQKLESIGQLAAGIAHEINTPIQYIGDNNIFLQQNCIRVIDLLTHYSLLLGEAKKENVALGITSQIEEMNNEVDLDYLIEEIPLALQQSQEGIRRVSEIVKAMKEFSHPGVREKTLLDINKALQDTLTVTRNEWKFVAEINLELTSELPKVLCLPAEINQVFLNIIMNAAQAIDTAISLGKSAPGLITITTLESAGWVEIRVSDTGTGIPDKYRSRIFELFFTTKEVGKGTGQGLAISYDVVVRKHGGMLTFETIEGEGTTFIIRLPIK